MRQSFVQTIDLTKGCLSNVRGNNVLGGKRCRLDDAQQQKRPGILKNSFLPGENPKSLTGALGDFRVFTRPDKPNEQGDQTFKPRE